MPLARQIQEQIERLIREGWLAPGVKLPATRELARALGVNRTTVSLAYEELAPPGRARAHVGQGTFVAAPPADGARAVPPAPAHVPLDWSRLYSRSAHIARSGAERRAAVPADTPRPLVSFAEGTPDSGLFPTDAFRRVLNQVVRAEGATLLQYPPGGDGYPPLRAYLATYLLRFGVEARADAILVVNGSQQGFDLIARTFLDPGDVVAMEQPTYPRAIDVFRAAGAQLVPVPWDREGPSAEALEQVLARHRPKLFYCQPTAHNPTGATMSPEAARRILDVAARHHVPVVEGGFDGSLYYGDRRPLPLRASTGTASSSTSARSRRSCSRASGSAGWSRRRPSWSGSDGQAARRPGDEPADPGRGPSLLRARLLDRHIARIAREYDRRRTALLAALGRHMPEGVSWTEPREALRFSSRCRRAATRRRSCPGRSAGGWASPPGPGSSSTGAGSARRGSRSPRCPRAGSTTASAASPRRSPTGGGAGAPVRRRSGLSGSRRWWCDPGSSPEERKERHPMIGEGLRIADRKHIGLADAARAPRIAASGPGSRCWRVSRGTRSSRARARSWSRPSTPSSPTT